MKLAFIPLMLLLVLLSLVDAYPDEATGIVTHVVDGDTFDVQLLDHDSRITGELIRIRLADIDCPETRGPKASEEEGRQLTILDLAE